MKTTSETKKLSLKTEKAGETSLETLEKRKGRTRPEKDRLLEKGQTIICVCVSDRD